MTELSPIVRSRSETETVAAGERFGRSLRGGDVVAIIGELGTGKTRFVAGVCRALGSERAVSSPTFTIVHEYRARSLTVYHFDFYRLRSVAELAEIGFAEYINRPDGICLIEWADRVGPALPAVRYEVLMSAGGSPDERVIEIRPPREEETA